MTGGEQYRNSPSVKLNLRAGRSANMVQYIEKYNAKGRRIITVNFHNVTKSFKRVEHFKYQGRFYLVYVDKNDSVYKLERTEVTSWKEVVKGKKKVRVPEAFTSTPETDLLNKIKGNPFSIAIEKIKTEIERESI